jgi:hypothetical protein
MKSISRSTLEVRKGSNLYMTIKFTMTKKNSIFSKIKLTIFKYEYKRSSYGNEK